ncbi:GNAT family N-acetyltransferase [Rheinheimera sp.]|uniref:GNAT family N-acetyltransferase n=1 Tax=Rheinheimera sp. TaxID=1869214 RepID=UPI0037CC50D4
MTALPLIDCTIAQNEKLLLKLMTSKDSSLFADLYCSERVMTYISHPVERRKISNSFNKAIAFNSDSFIKRCFIVIFSKFFGCDVGITGYTVFESEKEVEVGVMLLENFQSKNFAFETLSLLISLVIERYPDYCVVANLDHRNAPALNLVQRLGFDCIVDGKFALDNQKFLNAMINFD